jgi:hypothetical protein
VGVFNAVTDVLFAMPHTPPPLPSHAMCLKGQYLKNEKNRWSKMSPHFPYS